MIYLSKSKYCLGVQCPKMLWLKTFKNEEFDESVNNENVLKNGNIVGDLAMGLFGEYKEVPFGDVKEKIINTAVSLLNMLEYYGDEELADYVVNAIWNNDTLALYDLEDALEE